MDGSSDVLAGRVIAGRYRVVGEIGRGAMGVVLAAVHEGLRHEVAIKVLSQRGDDRARQRMLREARLAASLESEHVARVHDAGELADGSPFFVMDRLTGVDVGTALKDRGRFAPADAVDLAVQACDALAEAHAVGIVHRDIKPENLFVCHHSDGPDTVKVLDFGVAREALSQATGPGALLGTPRYMSPEQLEDPRCVDRRSDVWSLGATLYHMLEGHPPFDGNDWPAVVVAIRAGQLNPPTVGPDGLRAVVRRCLEPRREERPADMCELARQLVPFGGPMCRFWGRRALEVGAAIDEEAGACTPSGEIDGVERSGWIGHTIDGRFVVEALCGEGGFGVVYRGRHLALEEPVAIKLLKVPANISVTDRASLTARFKTEARLLHQLSRKNASIVQALDVGAATSPRGLWTPYIVMEWLEGHTLERRLRENGPSQDPAAAIELLAPVAAALATAHAAGVAHLDVKPRNVLLSTDGSMKLLDFGIAQVLRSDTVTQALTASGVMPAFSITYGAPEQFNTRHGERGPWTDVFALALVLIELCTGQRALAGDNPIQLYLASANESTRPGLARSGVPVSHEVDCVVSRALSVDPRLRQPNAAVFWRELSEAIMAPGLPLRRSLVSSPTADTLMAPDQRASQIHRMCTVLSAELSGSDNRLDPEQVNETVERTMEALHTAVATLRGSVERDLGDGLVAVFGLYEESDTAAERAVQAAIDMGLATEKDSVLSLCTGVATGRVLVTAEAGTGGFKLAPTGLPLKLASRLQQRARSGEILIDRDTHRQVSGLFETARLADGRAQRVLGPAPDRDALDVTAARTFYGFETRFIGREAEMAALRNLAEEVMDEGRPLLVTLLGPAGSGRSRILGELAARLQDEGWTVFSASCSSLQQHASYALAASLLRSRFGVHDDDPPNLAAVKLRRGMHGLRGRDSVQGVHDTWLLAETDVIDGLLHVVGKRHSGELAPDDDAALRKERVAAAFVTLLEAGGSPVAMLCDDMQWGDESSLTLLEAVCRHAAAPVLVVTSARPTLLDRMPLWGEGEPTHRRIPVSYVTRRHLEGMARDRLRLVAHLPDEVVAELVEHAAGSPLALVETLHLLVDAGAIEIDDDVWRLERNKLGELTIPSTVLGIVQARLDRLQPGTATLLAQAAVIGHTFWDTLLAHLARDEPRLAEMLHELRERGLISARAQSTFPEAREYRFFDRAAERVAYQMLGVRDRRRLHMQVACWLDERSTSEARAALVAHHYEKADAYDHAVLAFRRAGAYAATLGQNAEACLAYEHACAAEEAMPCGGAVIDWRQRAALRAELGDVLRRMGQYEAAETRYAESRSIVDAQDEADPLTGTWRVFIEYRMAIVDKLRGDIGRARDRLERALALAPQPKREEHAEMLALLASLFRREGRNDDCRAACLRGLRACRSIHPRSERWHQAVSKVLNALGALFLDEGRHARAERCYLQAARIIDERINPEQASQAPNNVAAVHYSRGDLVGARRSFRHALRLVASSGNPWMKTTVLANLGEVELGLGDPGGALDLLGVALRLSLQIRATMDLPEIYRNLARAHAALGNERAALESARSALESAQVSAGKIYLPRVLTTVTELYAALTDTSHEEAVELASAIRRAFAHVPHEVTARCRSLLEKGKAAPRCLSASHSVESESGKTSTPSGNAR